MLYKENGNSSFIFNLIHSCVEDSFTWYFIIQMKNGCKLLLGFYVPNRQRLVKFAFSVWLWGLEHLALKQTLTVYLQLSSEGVFPPWVFSPALVHARVIQLHVGDLQHCLRFPQTGLARNVTIHLHPCDGWNRAGIMNKNSVNTLSIIRNTDLVIW
jgi:hypothetical protein